MFPITMLRLISVLHRNVSYQFLLCSALFNKIFIESVYKNKSFSFSEVLVFSRINAAIIHISWYNFFFFFRLSETH